MKEIILILIILTVQVSAITIIIILKKSHQGSIQIHLKLIKSKIFQKKMKENLIKERKTTSDSLIRKNQTIISIN